MTEKNPEMSWEEKVDFAFNNVVSPDKRHFDIQGEIQDASETPKFTLLNTRANPATVATFNPLRGASRPEDVIKVIALGIDREMTDKELEQSMKTVARILRADMTILDVVTAFRTEAELENIAEELAHNYLPK